MRSLGKALLVATMIVSLVAPGVARADPPVCPDVAPTDAQVESRLSWLDAQFADHEDDVRRWYTLFAVAHGLLGSVNLTMALSTNDDLARIDLSVNTIGSFLGLITLLISTPPILGAGDMMRALDRTSSEARLASLRLAEARLQRSAEATAFVRSEFTSLLSTGYVAAASITLIALGRTTGGILHAVGGSLIAQGRLLLHPTGAMHAWRRYRARHPDAACAPLEGIAQASEGPGFALAPAGLGQGGYGLSFSMTF